MNKYNGWTNYATWRLNLEIFDTSAFLPRMDDPAKVVEYAEILKSYVEEILEQEGRNTLCFDYAMAFVDYVNYIEIAEKIIRDTNDE